MQKMDKEKFEKLKEVKGLNFCRADDKEPNKYWSECSNCKKYFFMDWIVMRAEENKKRFCFDCFAACVSEVDKYKLVVYIDPGPKTGLIVEHLEESILGGC